MADNSEILLDSGCDKLTSKTLYYFWIGFIIYSASFALSTTTTVNFIVCLALQILGFTIFIPTAIKLIHWRFDNKYLKIIYFFYCIWLLIVILRGFSFEYDQLAFNLFDSELGLFRYFVPLVLLFPKNLNHLKIVFKVIVVLGILFFIFSILFIDNMLDVSNINYNAKFTIEYFIKSLCLPSGFIILTFLYHTNRRKFLAFFVIAVGIGFSILRARRGLLFMTLSPLVISFMLYLFAVKRKFSIILFSLFIGPLLFFYVIKVYNENKYGVFSLITDRIYEDTRTGVEEYFYQDMNNQDWIIGKGINGEYFCPGVDEGDLTGYRSVIETDYLNIILKGGIISLGLLFLILIPAIIKGIFYSKNLLSKAAAIWILLWLIDLYPATVNTFSLNHLLVWISLGICYSENIRNAPESTVIETLSD